MAATTPPKEEAGADLNRRASSAEDGAGAPAEEEKSGPEGKGNAVVNHEAKSEIDNKAIDEDEADPGSADSKCASADDPASTDARQRVEITSGNAGSEPGPGSAAARSNKVNSGWKETAAPLDTRHQWPGSYGSHGHGEYGGWYGGYDGSGGYGRWYGGQGGSWEYGEWYGGYGGPSPKSAGQPPSNAPPPPSSGCSCHKSRCLKLYCQCFGRGTACDPYRCRCVSCQNTPDMARARNAIHRPSASPGCSCRKSRCLRLYCQCFASSSECDPSRCKCSSCSNGPESGEEVAKAKEAMREKDPRTFYNYFGDIVAAAPAPATVSRDRTPAPAAPAFQGLAVAVSRRRGPPPAAQADGDDGESKTAAGGDAAAAKEAGEESGNRESSPSRKRPRPSSPAAGAEASKMGDERTATGEDKHVAPAFQGLAVAVSRRKGPRPARTEGGDGGAARVAEKEANAEDVEGESLGEKSPPSMKRARPSSLTAAAGEDGRMGEGGAEGGSPAVAKDGNAATDKSSPSDFSEALWAARERAWSIVTVAERLHGGSFAFAPFAGEFAAIVQGEADLMRKEAVQILEVLDGTGVFNPLPISEARDEVVAFPLSAKEHSEAFESMVSELAEYKKVHGHCRVPSKEKTRDGRSLGAWVCSQRLYYRRYQKYQKAIESKKPAPFKRYELGSMDVNRITTLEKMGFQWEVSLGDSIRNAHEGTWNEMYEQLKKFKEKTGHCRVVSYYRSESESEKKLAQWVIRQRNECKKRQEGDGMGLTDERKEKLDKIGFDWTVSGTYSKYHFEKHDAQWRVMFQHLRDFSEKNGHCRVPQMGDMVKLHRWIATQRHYFKKRQSGQTNSLSDEKIAMLESIPGFEWSRRAGKQTWRSDDPNWDAMYDTLRDYERENGTCEIPFEARGKHYQLQRWISMQKAKTKKLEELGLLALDKDGDESDNCAAETSPKQGHIPISEKWEILFSELREFALRNGHCRVTTGSDLSNYSRLSGWVGTQRKEWRKMQEGKKSSMTEEKVRRLEELGFDFAPKRGTPPRKQREIEGRVANSS